jgi:hypothetical protein
MPGTEARKDAHHITRDWELIGEHIDGVRLREVRHVITRNGQTTEIHRDDWGICTDVMHVVHVMLRAGTLSAWHKHERQTDHIFCVAGMLKVALYDDRDASPTRVARHPERLARAELLRELLRPRVRLRGPRRVAAARRRGRDPVSVLTSS